MRKKILAVMCCVTISLGMVAFVSAGTQPVITTLENSSYIADTYITSSSETSVSQVISSSTSSVISSSEVSSSEVSSSEVSSSKSKQVEQSSSVSSSTTTSASVAPVTSTSSVAATTTSKTSSTTVSKADKSLVSSEAPKPSESITTQQVASPNDEYRAVWFYFSELSAKGKNAQQYEAYIDGMFDKVANAGYNTVICQVRPYGDAFYPSEIFPWSSYVTGTQGVDPGYDPLALMVNSASERGLRFEAWINPLRASSSSTDFSKLSTDNYARIWHEDNIPENDDWAVAAAGGIYYNPAIPEVRNMIIAGVREIVANYNVNAIHMDDYFYPTTSASFDSAAYSRYQASGGSLGLADWRRANVDTLVNGIYTAVHETKPDVEFGISPSCFIDRNYNEYYADIGKWMSSTGYIDYIAPQLYFGFEYPKSQYQYMNLLESWKKLHVNKDIDFYVGLGIYKSGAKDGSSTEWIDHNDIIAREIQEARKYGEYDGFAIYSYSKLFGTTPSFTNEREAIDKVLN